MDWIELPHPESPRRRRFGGTARKRRLGKRVERWGLRALAALGCVIALGAGYASATSMASMTVFGIQLPGITSGYVNGIADSDKGLLFSEGQTNAQAVVGAIAPDGATSVVDSDLALGSAPFEMAEDPAGNIWVADTGVPAGIVKIAPDGEKTRFPTPGQPTAIAIGPDGSVWFTGQPGVGEITADGQITTYTNGVAARAIDIAAGSDGAMWFTSGYPTPSIGRITLGGTVTSYSDVTTSAGGPFHLALGPDGNMWYTEMNGVIGRITPSGVVSEFRAGIASPSALWSIAAAPDGNMWFTDMASPRRVGEITPNGTITEYTVSSTNFSPGPTLATGPDGKLWFDNTQAAGVLGQLDIGAPPASIAPPELSGLGRQGDPESCGGARWSDWAGSQPSTSANSFDGYQWLRDGNPIVGQTAQTYTLAATDAGHELSCKLTATYTLFPATVSATSAAISVPPAAPGAPTDITAVAGDGQAVVSFTPPATDGGAAITSYTVTALPGGETATGSTSPITVTGLLDGTSYTFTVTATNNAGVGATSISSGPVTPAAPSTGGGGGGGGGGGAIPDLALTLAAPTQVAPGGQATYNLAVSDLNGAGASSIHAIVTLPTGATVDSTTSDRGPGCSTGTAAGTLDCNLDFLSGTLVAHVTIILTLPTAGQATMTATVSDAQGDKNHADNTATATVQVGSPGTTTVPAPTPKPVATKTAPTVTILGVKPVLLKGSPKLHVTLKLSQAASVELILLAPNGKTVVAHWHLRLTAGLKTLALALPAKARHQGHDTLHIQIGKNKPKAVRVLLLP